METYTVLSTVVSVVSFILFIEWNWHISFECDSCVYENGIFKMRWMFCRMVAQQFRQIQASSQKQVEWTRQLVATALATGARISVKSDALYSLLTHDVRCSVGVSWNLDVPWSVLRFLKGWRWQMKQSCVCVVISSRRCVCVCVSGFSLTSSSQISHTEKMLRLPNRQTNIQYTLCIQCVCLPNPEYIYMCVCLCVCTASQKENVPPYCDINCVKS